MKPVEFVAKKPPRSELTVDIIVTIHWLYKVRVFLAKQLILAAAWLINSEVEVRTGKE